MPAHLCRSKTVQGWSQVPEHIYYHASNGNSATLFILSFKKLAINRKALSGDGTVPVGRVYLKYYSTWVKSTRRFIRLFSLHLYLSAQKAPDPGLAASVGPTR